MPPSSSQRDGIVLSYNISPVSSKVQRQHGTAGGSTAKTPRSQKVQTLMRRFSDTKRGGAVDGNCPGEVKLTDLYFGESGNTGSGKMASGKMASGSIASVKTASGNGSSGKELRRHRSGPASLPTSPTCQKRTRLDQAVLQEALRVLADPFISEAKRSDSSDAGSERGGAEAAVSSKAQLSSETQVSGASAETAPVIRVSDEEILAMTMEDFDEDFEDGEKGEEGEKGKDSEDGKEGESTAASTAEAAPAPVGVIRVSDEEMLEMANCDFGDFFDDWPEAQDHVNAPGLVEGAVNSESVGSAFNHGTVAVGSALNSGAIIVGSAGNGGDGGCVTVGSAGNGGTVAVASACDGQIVVDEREMQEMMQCTLDDFFSDGSEAGTEDDKGYSHQLGANEPSHNARNSNARNSNARNMGNDSQRRVWPA